MKCYYEELAVERSASGNEIKSAYRKLALKWHPDKNPDCLDSAKEQFLLIQQAYEVLSDPQERAWYDNHREQILRGKNSNFEDNCLDLFQYFTVTCFKGFEDDENGFYAVYREVFKKISVEDADFMDNEEDLLNIPMFGDSKSSYEEITRPFYTYWSTYCTKRTYTWLCPYNIREVKDRRILREIEKEMKKVAQKAKKERNEEVRNLVSFVRKRDKRVHAFKQILEERSAFNREKQQTNRREQIKRRQIEIEHMKNNSQTTNESNADYEEKLKQLELEYSTDDEFIDDGEPVESANVQGSNYNDGLYCVACNKQFKTKKSFANHEISRKHCNNIEKLKIEMQDEENVYLHEENFMKLNKMEIEDLLEGNKKTLLPNGEDIKSTLLEKTIKTKTMREAKIAKQSNKSDLKESTVEISEEIVDLEKVEQNEDWNSRQKKLNKKNKNKSKISKTKSSLLDEHPFESDTVFKNKEEELEHMKNNSQTTNESKADYEENLKQLELEYSTDDEFIDDGEPVESDNVQGSKFNDGLFCVACNKQFKTKKSFANHEISRKHCNNIEKLKIEMQDEETVYLHEENFMKLNKMEIEDLVEGNKKTLFPNGEDIKSTLLEKTIKTKTMREAKIAKQFNKSDLKESTVEISEEIVDLEKVEQNEDWDSRQKKLNKKNKNKIKISKTKSSLLDKHPFESDPIKNKEEHGLKFEATQFTCATCKSNFESKNKLFSHLKLTNHAVFVHTTKNSSDENSKSGKGRSKKK